MNSNIQLVLLVLVIVFLSAIFWRQAAIGLMYWIVLVGAVRKWLLPQYSDYIFFTPHFILTGIYLGQFMGGRVRVRMNGLLKFFLSLLLLWGASSFFNPRLPDYRVGILGLLVHFYFIPFAFIIPKLFRTKEEVIRFIKAYIFFSIPVLVLGAIQFFSPLDSPINRYASETSDIAPFYGMDVLHARVTSAFPYISSFAAYLNVLILFLFYILSIRKLSPFLTLLFSGLTVFAVTNLFMVGSRGAVGATAIGVSLYLFAATRLGLPFIVKLSLRILFLVMVVIFSLKFSPFSAKLSTAYQVFAFRVESYEDEMKERLIDTVTPLKFFKDAGLFGWGIGSTYQGAGKLVTDWGTMNRDFEEEPERILMELGLIGYFLVYFLRLLFVLEFWKLFKRLRNADLRLLALVSLFFQVQFLQLNSLVFNHTSGIFYWFFIGFLFLLPRLDMNGAPIGSATNPNLTSG